MSRPRVLVTGAGGFTGRYVIEALRRRGHEIRGLEARPAEVEGCSIVRVDLLEETDALQRAVADFEPTHVLHLAALAHVTESRPEAHYAVNTVATGNLLRVLAMRGSSLARVVLASSANLYGNASTSPITEATPVQPVNHYGFSKWVMENMAFTWYRELPVLVTRPFNYTGVGQSTGFVVPKIVNAFVHRAPVLKLGNIDVSRDISDVRAVAEAYARLLGSDTTERVVNICSGRATSLRSILADLEALSGHRPDVQVDPTLVRANEIRELTGDGNRLQRAVGPLEFPPMRETLEWMYRHG